MRHVVFAMAMLALLAGSTGCRMCAHPYDYSGPTVTDGCGQSCGGNTRSGSILSGTVVSEAEMFEGPLMPVPDQQTQATPEGWHPSSGSAPAFQIARGPVEVRQR